VTVDEITKSTLGIDNFTEFELYTYEKYQAMAEREIIDKLNELLSNFVFLQILKQWGAQCACSYQGCREIIIKLKSGSPWSVLSPVFYRADSEDFEAKEKTR